MRNLAAVLTTATLGLMVHVPAGFAQPVPSSIFPPLVATPGHGDATDAAPDPVVGAQPSGEERLWKRLSILNRQWELASRHAEPLSPSEFEEILGQGRRRALDVARFQFHLHNPAYVDRDLRDDPEAFESVKDTVLSTFLKLERESLEEVLGINRYSERRNAKRAAQRADTLAEGPSWKMRLSPRFSDDYVGLKLRFPYTKTAFMDHLSFRVEQDFEGETGFSLQWDNGKRLFFLEHATGDEDLGSYYQLSVRLFF